VKIFKFDCEEFNSLKFDKSDEVFTALDLKIKPGTKLFLFRHNINKCLEKLADSDIVYLDFDNDISYFYYGYYRVIRILGRRPVNPSNFVYINSNLDFNLLFNYYSPATYVVKKKLDKIEVTEDLLNVNFVDLLTSIPVYTKFEFTASEMNILHLILLGELYAATMVTNKVNLIVSFDQLSETTLILSSILNVRSKNGFLTEDDYSTLVEELSGKLDGLKSLSERKEQKTTRLFRESIM